MNKVFPDQVCREGRWWERVCLSVHAHMHACMCVRTGVGGVVFFVLVLPSVKFKQCAVTRSKCHFPPIHLNLASILKLTFDLLKC